MKREIFFDAVRGNPFPGSLRPRQVVGMDGILDAFAQVGDGRAKTLAYALATAYHEVGGRMVPVREGFAKTDGGARRAVANLAKRRGPRSAVAKYSKPTGPHGHVYYGRGHAQLTWMKNYARSSDDAGVDLVENPDAMLDPIISARVLIRGLMDGRWNGRGKGIGHYLPDDTDDGSDDLKNARRTVNVTDKWQLIGEYYRAFLAAIRAAGGVPTAEDDDFEDDQDAPDDHEPMPDPDESPETAPDRPVEPAAIEDGGEPEKPSAVRSGRLVRFLRWIVS